MKVLFDLPCRFYGKSEIKIKRKKEREREKKTEKGVKRRSGNPLRKSNEIEHDLQGGPDGSTGGQLFVQET